MSSETEEIRLPKHVRGNITEISRGAEANSLLLQIELFFPEVDDFIKSMLFKKRLNILFISKPPCENHTMSKLLTC